MRKVPLATGEIYHIFNRGVNKDKIFFSERDYRRFLEGAEHYKTQTKKFSNRVNTYDTGSSAKEDPKVEIIAYCLMPNHFHFILKQLTDNGITSYMRHLMNSYSHYISVKYDRVGPLFQGRFKNVLVESDEQLLHLSRYIHLNPFVAGLVTNLVHYPWSSHLEYLQPQGKGICNSQSVLGHFVSVAAYKDFVTDHADYAQSIELIKHMTIDEE